MRTINYECPTCHGGEIEIEYCDAIVTRDVLGWDDKEGNSVVGDAEIQEAERVTYRCKKCGRIITDEGDDEFHERVSHLLTDDDDFDPSSIELDADQEIVKLGHMEEIMLDGAFLAWDDKRKKFSYRYPCYDPGYWKDGEEVSYVGHGRYIRYKKTSDQ